LKSGYLWLASLVACPLSAWPLLLHRSYRRFSLPCRIGLAFASGGVLLSTWMTLFALAGILWQPIVLLAMSALTAFLLRFLLRKQDSAAPERTRPGLPAAMAAAISTLAVLIAVAATTSAAATSPDLLYFWGPKAQAFAFARTFDLAFLRDYYMQYVHVSYPPLVTNLYAFASMIAGKFAWGAATLTFPLCLGALALSLPSVLRGIDAGPSGVFASTFLVATFGFLGNNLDVAGNGEPWLWIYETLAAALLVGPFAATAAGQLLAGLLIAGAATAKVEALPFALAVAALFLYLRRREIEIGPAAAFLLLPTAISLGAWLAFGATHRLFAFYEQYGSFFDIRWQDLGDDLGNVGKAIWSAGWALPWLLPLAALLAARKRSRPALLPVLVSVVLAAFFVFTYLHQSDPAQWISWSAGRVFSPIVAFLTVAAAISGR